MSKMKIEIRKPQYLAAKEFSAEAKAETGERRTPFFFRLLLVATYVLSGLAIWYVYQRYSIQP
ncbi:MAG: hypothetical protein WC133_05045 [Candidatus Omnitrophota bacterium]